MRRRLYFLLPDVVSALRTAADLLLAGSSTGTCMFSPNAGPTSPSCTKRTRCRRPISCPAPHAAS